MGVEIGLQAAGHYVFVENYHLASLGTEGGYSIGDGVAQSRR